MGDGLKNKNHICKSSMALGHPWIYNVVFWNGHTQESTACAVVVVIRLEF